MERAQLRYLLHSGPSRVLDVRGKHFGDGCDPLFKTSALNSAIIIKQSGYLVSDDENLPPIANKIFLPYDRDRPDDGGKSFFFTPRNLKLAFGDEKGADPRTAADIASDISLLSLFDKLPTFSPYLMKDVLERAGVAIPEGYFSVPEREAGMIKARVRARLRPLVATAFGGGDKPVGDSTIESLVEKLWLLKDLQELAPLIAAFRISMEDAPETFYCWLGITFFENEYIKLQPELKKMATWMGLNAALREPMPREVLAEYRALILRARQLLQQNWKGALEILNEYTRTYESLIAAGGSAQQFIEYLRHSKDHFWTLGGSLGRLEQSVEIWHHVCAKVDYKALNYEHGRELFAVLNTINAPDAEHPAEAVAAAV